MKIVLDCNVLLVALPSKSPYHAIYQKVVDGSLAVIVSNEILLEYFEVLSVKTSREAASDVVDMFIGNPSTIKAEPFYKFVSSRMTRMTTNMRMPLSQTMQITL